jgi:ATP-dependent Zn protease
MVGDTIGYTPVKIRYVINEAVVVSHWDGRDVVTYKDWSRAIENHEFGLRQPIKSMSVDEKRRLSYHETGHALAMVLCMPRERLHKVTIIRHGSALGFAAWKPKEETYTMTKDEYLARIRVSLASRAAEQIFLGCELSGAHHDLQSATQIADLVIRHFGMSGSLYQPAALGQLVPGMEESAKIEELLEDQFQQVKRMLQSHEKAIHAIAAALLEKLELTGEEVIEIIEREEGPEALSANGHAAVIEEVYGLPGIFSVVRRKPNGVAQPNGHNKETEVAREAAATEPASEGM